MVISVWLTASCGNEERSSGSSALGARRCGAIFLPLAFFTAGGFFEVFFSGGRLAFGGVAFAVLAREPAVLTRFITIPLLFYPMPGHSGIQHGCQGKAMKKFGQAKAPAPPNQNLYL